MKEIKFFKKSDLIVIAVVLVIAALLFIPKLIGGNNLNAIIYVNGETAYEINLNTVEESYTISTNTNPATQITVEKGRICFSSSDCKDKLCKKSGWLDTNGQTAACLPANVVISIKGSDKVPDMMTY